MSSLRTPPSAHGARTSHSTSKTPSGATASAPSSSTARATRSAFTSAATGARPASTTCRARPKPTLPRPWIATVLPASPEPDRLEQRGADPRKTPSAVASRRLPPPPPRPLARTCGSGASCARGRGCRRSSPPAVMYVHLEVGDEPAHRLEERLRLVAGVGHDDRLAAAEPGMRDRRLVRHRPRSLSTSSKAALVTRVRPQPHAAERRAEPCRVDADVGAQPAPRPRPALLARSRRSAGR